MSENNQQNELLKNQIKKDDNTRAESLKGLKEDRNRNDTFQISVCDLENLMGFYKERGADCLDLKEIENFGGTQGIIKRLATDALK